MIITIVDNVYETVRKMFSDSVYKILFYNDSLVNHQCKLSLKINNCISSRVAADEQGLTEVRHSVLLPFQPMFCFLLKIFRLAHFYAAQLLPSVILPAVLSQLKIGNPEVKISPGSANLSHIIARADI